MWLFDKRSFTSTVAYDPAHDSKDTEHKKVALASADPKAWLLMRARVQADLEAVEEQIRTLVYGGDESFTIYIAEDQNADYAFRALVSRPDMKAYLIKQVDEIDYGSHFKEVVQKNATQGAARHSAMMTVWTAMLRLSPKVAIGSSDWSKSGKWWSEGQAYDDDWKPPASWKDTSTKQPTLFSSPAVKLPPLNVVDVDGMAQALRESSVCNVLPDTINGATDDAFELWLEADLVYGADARLTDEQVDGLCDKLNNQAIEQG